jgi:hypothetical protein
MLKETQAFQRVATALALADRPAYDELERHRAKLRFMAWLLFSIATVLMVWDVFLATNGQPGDTWSEQARIGAPLFPVLPWFLGAMVGHMFPLLGHRPRLFGRDAAAGAMGWLTALVILWSGLIQFGVDLPIAPPAIWLTALGGMGASYLLWPRPLAEVEGEAR